MSNKTKKNSIGFSVSETSEASGKAKKIEKRKKERL